MASPLLPFKPAINDLHRLIVINEVYGPVLQGEGPKLGRPCIFVRLGGCNLACSWCDTAYTWDWRGVNGTQYNPKQELIPIPGWELLQLIQQKAEMICNYIDITGGEPLLQQDRLTPLLEALHNFGYEVDIETNGTIVPNFSSELVSCFNVSPKLSSSGNLPKPTINGPAIDWFLRSGKAIFKFVVSRQADFAEVDFIRNLCNIPRELIIIMPEGATRDGHIVNLQKAEQWALLEGYRITPRLHILMHNYERGV